MILNNSNNFYPKPLVYKFTAVLYHWVTDNYDTFHNIKWFPYYGDHFYESG